MGPEIHCWWESNLYGFLEGNLVVLNTILKKTIDPVIPLLGIYPTEKGIYPTEIHSHANKVTCSGHEPQYCL